MMVSFGIMEVVLIILASILLIFWIWMLIDCLKRDDDDFAIGGRYAKLIWVLVIIFAHFIGAILYFFLVKEHKTAAQK